MKIIDGKDAVMGRLAVFAAKEALKGEEIIVVNCDEVIITGGKASIKKEFEETRTKVGSGLRGPKISRLDYKIVKRAIRGMLPNHRRGRGKTAYGRVKCYNGVPEKFKDSEKISLKGREKIKFIKVKDLRKK